MGGRQQQGAALLMVMVVLAMLAAGMAWLVEDGRRQVDEVRLLHQRVQVRAMEQAGLAYAGQALRDPAWRLSPLFWQALRGQPLNYDFGAGQAQLRVRDQHTCFNVNALLGADGERAERQLRYLLGNDMAAERLVDALADWLDADSDARLQGAESAQYLRQQPPRLASGSSNRFSSLVSSIGWSAARRVTRCCAPCPRPRVGGSTPMRWGWSICPCWRRCMKGVTRVRCSVALSAAGRRRGLWTRLHCVRRLGRWMTKRSNG